jgi:hypothetical protein
LPVLRQCREQGTFACAQTASRVLWCSSSSMVPPLQLLLILHACMLVRFLQLRQRCAPARFCCSTSLSLLWMVLVMPSRALATASRLPVLETCGICCFSSTSARATGCLRGPASRQHRASLLPDITTSMWLLQASQIIQSAYCAVFPPSTVLMMLDVSHPCEHARPLPHTQLGVIGIDCERDELYDPSY